MYLLFDNEGVHQMLITPPKSTEAKEQFLLRLSSRNNQLNVRF